MRDSEDFATAAIASLPLVPTAEEVSIRESVRGICAAFGNGYAREKYARGEPPTEAWNALAEKGFVGANIPQEWGGGGLGMRGLAVVGEEVAAAGIPTLMLVVSSAIAGSILARHGSDEQNERWLRGIAAGTTKLAFAITEPDAGTIPTTCARRCAATAIVTCSPARRCSSPRSRTPMPCS